VKKFIKIFLFYILMSEKIFISIACFMDSDIINTINDCIDKAKNPDNLVFGICYQCEDNDNLLEKYENKENFRIIKMNWKDAKGPAYARALIYDLFKNEDYYFQIDCHTRFFKNWDEKILFNYNLCKKINNKAIISYYPINVNNVNNEKMLKNIANISTVREVTLHGGIKTHGRYISVGGSPTKSWGISAAMLFFDKEIYHLIPFDKNIYFGLQFEEQVVLACRYWTNGVDIFTPIEHIISTEYITNRKRQKRHLLIDTKKKKQSFERLCHLMKLNKNSEYDETTYLGQTRSVKQYYKYLNIYDKVKTLFKNNYLD